MQVERAHTCLTISAACHPEILLLRVDQRDKDGGAAHGAQYFDRVLAPSGLVIDNSTDLIVREGRERDLASRKDILDRLANAVVKIDDSFGKNTGNFGVVELLAACSRERSRK